MLPDELNIGCMCQNMVKGPVKHIHLDVLWCPEGAATASPFDKSFHGPLGAVITETLAYIQRNYLTETVIKNPHRAEANRVCNFSLPAIGAALECAGGHLPFRHDLRMVVRISYNELTVHSAMDADLHHQIADSQTADAEAIFKVMAANGYPTPVVETSKDGSALLIRLPAHALVEAPFAQASKTDSQ